MLWWLRRLFSPRERAFLSTTRESDVSNHPPGISHPPSGKGPQEREGGEESPGTGPGVTGHYVGQASGGDDESYAEQSGAEARSEDVEGRER